MAITTWDWVEELQRGGSRDESRSTSGGPARRGPDPKRLRARLMWAEGLAVAVAWTLALFIGSFDHPFWSNSAVLVLEAVALGALAVALSWACRLYRSRVAAVRSVTAERQALIAIALAGVAYLPQRTYGEQTVRPMIIGGVLGFLGLVVTRSMFEAWLTFHRANGALSRPVLLIGRSQEVMHLSHLLENHPEIGYHSVGFLSDEIEPTPVGVRHLGGLGSTVQALEETGATGVLIAANGVPSVELNSLVRTLHSMGVHVHLSSGLTRIGHRRVRQLPMAHEPFFYLEPASPRRMAMGLKRMADIVVASLVLVLTSPLLLIAAVAVKISDGGPVFFHQVRIGQDGRRITIRKIRSMTVDAEDQLDDLRDLNERTGPLFKLDDDPRITRVGHWLRVSSIDELPQLLNVLDGSLSLIGPRPALPDEVAQFDDEMLGRLRMRPGVTGLWQVEARHNPSYFAYRHLDLFYVENWSLGLDVAILVATARTVVGDALRSLRRGSSSGAVVELEPSAASAASVG